MHNVKIEYFFDIKYLESVWNITLDKCNQNNIFLTYEWLTCWLETYACDSKQFIICIKEDSEIIALAPLIIVNHNEFGLKLKKLQFIGDGSCDYMDFIITKNHKLCIDIFFDYIFNYIQMWDFCVLNHFSSEYCTLFSNTISLKSRYSLLNKINICPYINLNSDIDSFLKLRKTGLRYDLKRGESEFKKNGTLSYTKIIDNSQALKELPLFFDMLYRRRKKVNREGTKQSNMQLENIFISYIKNTKLWPSINFCKLSFNGQPIAYHFGFEHNKKLYWYKPTFDMRYTKNAPGKLLIKKSIEYAIENNFVEFDFLLGSEPYKFQWSSEVRESFSLYTSNERYISIIIFYWFNFIKPFLKKTKYFVLKLKK